MIDKDFKMRIKNEDLKNYIGEKICLESWGIGVHAVLKYVGKRWLVYDLWDYDSCGIFWYKETIFCRKNDDEWYLFEELKIKEEPKKTVRRWLWDYSTETRRHLGTTWLTENEAKEYWGDVPVRKTTLNGQEVYRDFEE